MSAALRELEAQLGQLDEAIASVQAELDQADAGMAEAERLREQLPGVEADLRMGKLTPEQAEAKRSEAVAIAAQAWTERDQLEGALAELRRRAADLAREINAVRRAKAEEQLQTAEAAREQLERQLEAAERAERAARERVSELQAGGASLLARYDAAAEKHVGDCDRQRREQLAWAATQGPGSFDQIPENLRAEAQALWDERHSPEARKRQQQEEIEQAKARGDGVSINGEVVVEPRAFQPVVRSGDQVPDRGLRPHERFPRVRP